MAKRKSHWILDSPLAKRSLKGTVERDTVKGSLWRPAYKEKQKRTITSHTQSQGGPKLRKISDVGKMKVDDSENKSELGGNGKVQGSCRCAEMLSAP